MNRNRLTLLESGLQGPEVWFSGQQPLLSVSPYFKMRWRTDGCGSRLGCIQLVEASRTLRFAEGEELVLLDTDWAGGGPVLYSGSHGEISGVEAISPFQPQGMETVVNFAGDATQMIPKEFLDQPDLALTVLEKYTVYFVENAAPEDAEAQEWTPLHLPIIWGWSVRVQQRLDGVWDIFRRKLVLPTISTEAPTLPVWHTDTLHCSRIAV